MLCVIDKVLCKALNNKLVHDLDKHPAGKIQLREDLSCYTLVNKYSLG